MPNVIHLHDQYRPLMVIVNRDDLKDYLAIDRQAQNILSFNEFIKRKYNRPESDRVIAVYRDSSFKLSEAGNNFDSLVFNGTDFIRADFANITMVGTSWRRSILIKAVMIDKSEPQTLNCKFNSTLMLGTNFSNSNFSSSNFNDSDINYSVVTSTSFNDTIDKAKHELVDFSEAGPSREQQIADQTATNTANIATLTSVLIKMDYFSENKTKRQDQQERSEEKINRKICFYNDPVSFHYRRRKDIDLEYELESPTVKISNITGICGSGKTELVRNWLHNSEKSGKYEQHIIWELLADNEDNLIDSYKKLGSELIRSLHAGESSLQTKLSDFESTNELEELKKQIEILLRNIQKPFILFYDNLEVNIDYIAGISLVEKKENSRIFITSHKRLIDTIKTESRNIFSFIPLQIGMDLNEAVSYLLSSKLKAKRQISFEEKNHAVALCQELDCLPLALTAARLYMDNKTSIREFLDLLHNEKSF